ncbi:MAG: hypothetical protein OEQ25_13830 [Gammaproteobacteria bacterium]|nr:hypothetical protein [Gammaproteobacteria bacterium]MDH3508208.1 hypothetical protein [Gammaproteobacteria bacterium]
MAEAGSEQAAGTPSGNRLWMGTLVALGAALVLLVTAILPSEYGIDPTGIGGVLGLTALTAPAGRTLEITDVIGGNEEVRTVEIPDYGDPVPLPNPGVHQDQAAEGAAQTRTMTITIPAESETEIKTVLTEGKMILYTWSVDRGDIYSDFHGHDPEVSDEFWVRYREHQEGAGGSGSLVAPFSGEHGWYWLNYNDYPVTVTLTLTGYFDDVIDYGIF